MRVLGGWRGRLWLSGTGLAAFCLFCPSQWHNFVWGFEPCFMLPGLFATLSFIGLLLYWIDSEQQSAKPSSWKFIALSIAAALGATLVVGKRKSCLALLVVAALFLRLRRSVVLSFTVTGAITIALYLYHYVSRQAEANAGSFRGDPLRCLQFVAVYLGTVWVHANPILAGIFGVAGAGFACAPRPALASVYSNQAGILYSTGSHAAVLHRHGLRHRTGKIELRAELRVFLAIPDGRAGLLVLPRPDAIGLRGGD
jgi:hypothetical protein